MKQAVQKPLPSIPHLVIQSQEFWGYTQPTNQEVEALDLFLSPNILQIQSLLPQPILNLEESYQALCQILQIRPHPSIKQKFNQGHDHSSDNIPNQNQIEQQPLQYVLFQNTKVDIITLKIVNFLWQLLPNLQVLKFFNICPTAEELNEICLMVQKNKITKVFLEFLSVSNDQLIQLCESIPKSNTIQHIYLRGNRLNDDHLSIFMKILEDNAHTTNINFIEITNNNITKRGVSLISSFMKKQNKIEYIGLGQNSLALWDDIKDLTDLLIKKKLSPEELQIHKDLESQKEAQIKAQLKQKGKKHKEIVPIQLQTIAQNQDGSFYVLQNSQFRVLNLAMNAFSDLDKDQFDKFMAQVQETFQLNLLMNNFEQKVKEKLKKKYKNLII